MGSFLRRVANGLENPGSFGDRNHVDLIDETIAEAKAWDAEDHVVLDPFWIVGRARSSNENYGPDYIVCEVDARLVKTIRDARRLMRAMRRDVEGYGHMVWHGAVVECFDAWADPDGNLWERLAWLVEDSGERDAACVPAGSGMRRALQEGDPPGCYGSTDPWRIEMPGVLVGSPDYGDTTVRPQADIKHTDVTIWFNESIAPLLDGLGIAIDHAGEEAS